MTKTEMRKFILAVIAPICEEHQYQRLPNHLGFYKIRDGVMSFVLFEGKSTGFESGLYVLPLYIPNENLILDYGNQIWRMDIRNAAKYALNCDMSEEWILRPLEQTKRYLQNTGFALLEHFGSPQGIIESISRKIHHLIFSLPMRKRCALLISSLQARRRCLLQQLFHIFIAVMQKKDKNATKNCFPYYGTLQTVVYAQPSSRCLSSW